MDGRRERIQDNEWTRTRSGRGEVEGRLSKMKFTWFALDYNLRDESPEVDSINGVSSCTTLN